jgi:MFS family permease
MTGRVALGAEHSPLQAWRGVLAWSLGAAFYFYAFVHRVSPSIMVDELMRDFAASGAVVGYLSAVYFYAYALMQIPVGVLMDRFGPRRLMSAAALIAALGSVLFAVSDGLPGASLGRLLVGVGSAFSWIGTLVLATYFFPPQRFALLIGIGQFVGMAGAVFGQAPLAALVAAWGWRASTMAIAALGLALAGGLWLTGRDRDGPSHHTAAGLVAGVRAVAMNAQTWLFAYLGMALATTLLAFAGLWAVPFFTVAYDLDRGTGAILASLLFIGWGIGAPLLGWLSDRLGRRRRILILCCFLLTVQLVAVIYVPALPLTILSGLLLGIGFVGSAMGLTFAGGRACNESAHAGAALGIINTAAMASGAAFQPLIGLFLDLGWDGRMAAGARLYGAADYRIALAVLPVVSALAVIVAMAVKEPRDPLQV